MKRFLTLIFFLTLAITSYSTVEAKNANYEKTDIPVANDIVSQLFVQNSQTVAERNINKDNSKRFDFDQENCGRYNAGITTSRYSKDYSINIEADREAYSNTIEKSKNIITESKQYNRGRLCMSRVGSCSEIIQRNYDTSTENNYGTRRGTENFKAGNTNNTKNSVCDWRCDSAISNRYNYEALIATQKRIANLPIKKSKYHG